MNQDIFISCRYDGTGDNFAARLCRDLEDLGYSVYFDVNESYTQNFPDHIRDAIAACQDFILILSSTCIERLRKNEVVDWVKEEILAAKKYEKQIIPILLEGASWPKDTEDMPEELRFLPYIPAIKFPVNYAISPFVFLIGKLNARKGEKRKYQECFNANPCYDVKNIFSKTLSAAQSGDVEAMYELGMMGFYGITNKEGTQAKWNFDQAAYWLKKVAETDHETSSHARSILARMYYQGTVPRESQSYEKALQLDRMAASEDTYSASNIGFMLRYGIGCEFSFDAVLGYYDQCTRNMDSTQMVALAKFYMKYGKFQEAYELLESMDMQSPEAKYQLGLMHRDGVLTSPPKPDYIAAGYCFRDAADDGHVNAAYEYGLLCLLACGRFRKDFLKAEKYLKTAADNGHSDAQYILGYMYRCGHVKKDLTLAVKYLEKAKNESSLAALELASVYQQPETQDFQKAYECAKIAAENGLAEGKLILGNLLLFGRGCEPDVNKAYEMYDQAHQQGIFFASVMKEKIDNIQKSGIE